MLAGLQGQVSLGGLDGCCIALYLWLTTGRHLWTPLSPHSALTEVCPGSRGRGIEPSSQQRPVSYYIVRRACGLRCWPVPELWKRPLTAPASAEPAASVSRSFCLHLVSRGLFSYREAGFILLTSMGPLLPLQLLSVLQNLTDSFCLMSSTPLLFVLWGFSSLSWGFASKGLHVHVLNAHLTRIPPVAVFLLCTFFSLDWSCLRFVNSISFFPNEF